MSTLIGVLRKRALAPSLASVGFAERGFPVTHTDATARLEAVPHTTACGTASSRAVASVWVTGKPRSANPTEASDGARNRLRSTPMTVDIVVSVLCSSGGFRRRRAGAAAGRRACAG